MSGPGRFEDKDFPRIELPCSTCGDACIRSVVDGEWVHTQDYVHLTGIYGGTATYDHPVTFDVIEAREVGEPPPKQYTTQTPGDPFNKIEFPRQGRQQ